MTEAVLGDAVWKDVVLIPVKWDQVPAVRAFLEQLHDEGASQEERDPEVARRRLTRPNGAEWDDGADWSPETWRRIFDRCQPVAKRILVELAHNGSEEPLYGMTIIERVAPNGHNNIGSYLSSLSSATKKYAGIYCTPLYLEQDPTTRLYTYQMHPKVAEIIKEFGD